MKGILQHLKGSIPRRNYFSSISTSEAGDKMLKSSKSPRKTLFIDRKTESIIKDFANLSEEELINRLPSPNFDGYVQIIRNCRKNPGNYRKVLRIIDLNLRDIQKLFTFEQVVDILTAFREVMPHYVLKSCATTDLFEKLHAVRVSKLSEAELLNLVKIALSYKIFDSSFLEELSQKYKTKLELNEGLIDFMVHFMEVNPKRSIWFETTVMRFVDRNLKQDMDIMMEFKLLVKILIAIYHMKAFVDLKVQEAVMGKLVSIAHRMFQQHAWHTLLMLVKEIDKNFDYLKEKVNLINLITRFSAASVVGLLSSKKIQELSVIEMSRFEEFVRFHVEKDRTSYVNIEVLKNFEYLLLGNIVVLLQLYFKYELPYLSHLEFLQGLKAKCIENMKDRAWMKKNQRYLRQFGAVLDDFNVIELEENEQLVGGEKMSAF